MLSTFHAVEWLSGVALLGQGALPSPSFFSEMGRDLVLCSDSRKLVCRVGSRTGGSFPSMFQTPRQVSLVIGTFFFVGSSAGAAMLLIANMRSL